MPVPDEIKKATAMALRGDRSSPAWEQAYFQDHCHDILYLVCSGRELQSAKHQHSRDFLEHLCDFCTNEQLIEMYTRAYEYVPDRTTAGSEYVSNYQKATRGVLIQRIYYTERRYMTRQEQFALLQLILTQRHGNRDDILTLAKSLLFAVTWPQEISKTGELLKQDALSTCETELVIQVSIARTMLS